LVVDPYKLESIFESQKVPETLILVPLL